VAPLPNKFFEGGGIGLNMDYEQKIEWLERIFSNDPKVRDKALKENPLPMTRDEFLKLVDDLLARHKKN